MIVSTWCGSRVELTRRNAGRWLLGWIRAGWRREGRELRQLERELARHGGRWGEA